MQPCRNRANPSKAGSSRNIERFAPPTLEALPGNHPVKDGALNRTPADTGTHQAAGFTRLLYSLNDEFLEVHSMQTTEQPDNQNNDQNQAHDTPKPTIAVAIVSVVSSSSRE